MHRRAERRRGRRNLALGVPAGVVRNTDTSSSSAAPDLPHRTAPPIGSFLRYRPVSDLGEPPTPCGRGAARARIRVVRWRRAVSFFDRDQLIGDAVAALPGPLGQNLLSILMLPQDER